MDLKLKVSKLSDVENVETVEAVEVNQSGYYNGQVSRD